MNEVLFTRIQFEIVGCHGHVLSRLLLDYPPGELSKQDFSYGEKITSSIGIYLTEYEKKEILPLINAHDYEPYRDMKDNDEWDQFATGYFDEVHAEFIGITNASIPLVRFSWSAFHDEKHKRPYEYLYEKLNSIVSEYEKKPRKRRTVIRF